MRTFSRAEWSAASDAWHQGGFDADTWYRVRYAAACRGMLYPPQGNRHDDIDAPRPSQRSIVYRALDETPVALMAAIAVSSSWTGVVAELIRQVNARRVELDATEAATERDAEARRYADRAAMPAQISKLWREQEEQREQDRLERMAAGGAA